MLVLLIFDLDGTLIDSRLDLVHAVNATRVQAGSGPLPTTQIFSFVGNGAPVLVKRAMGPEASEEEVANALEFFLDTTATMRSIIDPLSGGWRFAPPSACERRAARRPDEQAGSHQRADYEGSRPCAAVFPHLRRQQLRSQEAASDRYRDAARGGERTAENTWMVGDSWVDVQTARNAGVACCGVTWGFQPETFREFPPDVLVDHLEDFAERFIRP